jgi:hypothetical protein
MRPLKPPAPPQLTPAVLVIGLALVLISAATTALFTWARSLRLPAAPESPASDGPALPPEAPAGASVPAVRFTDVTEAAGIRFRHTNGASGHKLLPETMGSGVAVLDYDGDGRPDLLFVNSCPWPGDEEPDRPAPTLALYRNKGDGTFEDVTAAAGLAVKMYGMGVCVGDFDNDGWPDVFVTGVGGNRLFRNLGGKRFEDVTARAGVGGPGGWTADPNDFLRHNEPVNWSTSATWLDYDGDGRLDLFVCNYVRWSPDYDLSQGFGLTGTGRAYGPPVAFEGAQCFLYHNLGFGRFEDVSERAGIHVHSLMGRPVGKSLGVVACDVDDDGWPDVIVANDTVPNFLFRNRGDGTFEEVGVPAGAALAEGRARGAMGIDWGEYRRGRPAVFIGNFADEPDTFLRRDHVSPLLFSDVAIAEGIAGPSRPLLKFGALFLDYDLDGRLDLLTCNGHLEPDIAKVQAGQRYAQPPQLFWNSGADGRACFVPVRDKSAGPDLFRPMVGRACAYADLDGDGYPDLVLTENGGPARLLRNGGGPNHWLRLTLEGDGEHSNVSAIGARVTLEAGGLAQTREVLGARGYLSQSELTLTFGLGRLAQVDRVTIRWPGKRAGEEVLTGLAVDRTYRIRQSVPAGR